VIFSNRPPFPCNTEQTFQPFFRQNSSDIPYLNYNKNYLPDDNNKSSVNFVTNTLNLNENGINNFKNKFIYNIDKITSSNNSTNG
jgi:hypothetical protein